MKSSRLTARRVLYTGAALFLSCCPLELLAQDVPAALAVIPHANPFTTSRYLADLGAWHNPYVIVHKDHVEIFDRMNHTQRTVKVNALLRALSGLPRSAWPEGKIVALASADDVSAAGLGHIAPAYDAVSKDLAGAGVEVTLVIEFIY